MFIAIFSVVMGGLGAVFASPLRRIITRSMGQQVLRDNLLNSRPVQWLAGSFFITTVILFLAVVIENDGGFDILLYSYSCRISSNFNHDTYVGRCVFLILGGFRRD